MTYQDNTYYYITNIRGDVVALLDRYGNEAASYKYDIYGNPTITNPNNLPNPFLYQGAYATFYDSEFTMYGMGARHYDPKIMRFISRDFNHGSLTNTMSQNLYIHCYNNPIGYKDPSGFSPSCGGHSSFKGNNDTGESSMPEDNNDILSTNDPSYYIQDNAMEETWKFCLENNIFKDTKEDMEKFVSLWNQANNVRTRMQKYGGTDDKYDMKIAFWTCYWNDKAKLGLEGTELVSMANLMKGIMYEESTMGATAHHNEGLMQVNTFGAMSETHWVEDGFYKKWNGRLGEDDNAGIYAGIAHWCMDYSGFAFGPDQLNRDFNDFIGDIKSGKNPIHNKSIWKKATYRYGAGSDNDQRIKAIDPNLNYSDLVFDLVEKGRDPHFHQEGSRWVRNTSQVWNTKRGTGINMYNPVIYEEIYKRQDLTAKQKNELMNDANIDLP